MNRRIIKHANTLFLTFTERLIDPSNTFAQFVLLLTASVALAPLGSPLTESPVQLLIGTLCYIAILMLFLEAYCRLKERRVLRGRVRGSTILLMAMPVVVSATVLWIHYNEWFGTTAH